jgi:hypothetical protein
MTTSTDRTIIAAYRRQAANLLAEAAELSNFGSHAGGSGDDVVVTGETHFEHAITQLEDAAADSTRSPTASKALGSGS